MMLATSKHVFKIKTCRNLFKNYDLLSAVSAFWFQSKNYIWTRLTFLNKDLQFLEGLEEFFRGNSRITSDSADVGSEYVNNTFRLLYASRNCSEFVSYSRRSEWIVQPYLSCCDLQPLSRVITPLKSEKSLSREPRRIMIQQRIKVICLNFQVVVFENNFREFATLNAVCEFVTK